jgi:8-oxo-dGTP diphosphatase
MKLPGKWEFPGGKVEPGESNEAAIIREIDEELAIHISPVMQLTPSSYNYHHANVQLIPFVSKVTGGALRLREHSAARLLSPRELELLDWAEADKPIVREVIEKWDEITG